MSTAPPAVSVIGAAMLMSLCASRVRVLVPVVSSTSSAALRVMSPSWLPPAAVCTVTLWPPESAAVSRSMPSRALSPVLVKGSAAGMLVLPLPATISMSWGSMSQWPPLPAGAVVSGVRRIANDRRPEVSTKPPSPPAGPPRALKRPWTFAKPLANTTTLPPSPEASASAETIESAET